MAKKSERRWFEFIRLPGKLVTVNIVKGNGKRFVVWVSREGGVWTENLKSQMQEALRAGQRSKWGRDGSQEVFELRLKAKDFEGLITEALAWLRGFDLAQGTFCYWEDGVIFTSDGRDWMVQGLGSRLQEFLDAFKTSPLVENAKRRGEVVELRLKKHRDLFEVLDTLANLVAK